MHRVRNRFVWKLSLRYQSRLYTNALSEGANAHTFIALINWGTVTEWIWRADSANKRLG